MLPTSAESPGKAGNPENPTSGRGPSNAGGPRGHTPVSSYRDYPRAQTPRDPHHRHRRPRHLFKNLGDMPSHFVPPHITDPGRWEAAESGIVAGFTCPPRFGAARRGPDRDHIDFHPLPVVRPPSKSFGENNGDGSLDKITDETYRNQLKNFPDLPGMAHERIREFGNEIVACYPTQLCKFLNDALIETAPSSFAVFTKKNRTGQRWLMVFKSERGRMTVSYNKLLTNQLLVRCLNSVSVEIETIRGAACPIPQENCVFTFSSHTEATNFVSDIHESQTALWNHREVIMEQSFRNQHSDYYLEAQQYGYYSPRPMSARTAAGYVLVAPDIPPVLTPRMRVLPPVPHPNRHKRSPFTVSARTPREDMEENWRSPNENRTTPTKVDKDFTTCPVPGSVTQSPIRKRSKGSSKDSFQPGPSNGGGDADFVYNSLTHAMALQQSSGLNLSTSSQSEETPMTKTEQTDKESEPISKAQTKVFPVADILVSSKRDVGTGAPDEEFFSLGAGEIQFVDNGEDQFDEIKASSSTGQLLFSQILFGWNKVRHAEGCPNPNVRWWMGAAVVGSKAGSGEAPRIREFKGTFADEDTANNFTQLFQKGINKGNNPEARKKYVAQSLRKD